MLKRHLLFLVVLALAGNAAAQPAAHRHIELINREWQFTLGDPLNAQFPTFSDASWQHANLPHSFAEPYFLGSGFYTGYGWYRKLITLSPEMSNREVSLEFDGVFQDAEIFINGERAGRHIGGYTGFSASGNETFRFVA